MKKNHHSHPTPFINLVTIVLAIKPCLIHNNATTDETEINKIYKKNDNDDDDEIKTKTG